VPFPGWDEFEGPDSADLDDAARRAFAAAIRFPKGLPTRGQAGRPVAFPRFWCPGRAGAVSR
jgi:hypothetical protein